MTYNEFEKAMMRFDLIVYWDKERGELDLIGDGRIAVINMERKNDYTINSRVLSKLSPRDASIVKTICLGLAATPLERREP